MGAGISAAGGLCIGGSIAARYTTDAAAGENIRDMRTHVAITTAAGVAAAHVLQRVGGTHRGPHAQRRPSEALPQ